MAIRWVSISASVSVLQEGAEGDEWKQEQGKNDNLEHWWWAECDSNYLNLGFSLVTTPTSSSLALKSNDKTEDRQEMANWKDKEGGIMNNMDRIPIEKDLITKK